MLLASEVPRRSSPRAEVKRKKSGRDVDWLGRRRRCILTSAATSSHSVAKRGWALEQRKPPECEQARPTVLERMATGCMCWEEVNIVYSAQMKQLQDGPVQAVEPLRSRSSAAGSAHVFPVGDGSAIPTELRAI